jgi:hypothetical protein
MFTQGWAVKGLVAIGLRASNLLVTAGPGVAGLGPIPTLLTGMYAVAGLRHVRFFPGEYTQIKASNLQGYWVLFTSSFQLPTSISLQLIAYNMTLDTINTLVAVNALTSSPYPILRDFTDCIGWKQWTGLALFAIGISMETIAEESRKQFKKDPKNKGKIDDTGLWCIPNNLSFAMFNFLLQVPRPPSELLGVHLVAHWDYPCHRQFPGINFQVDVC